MIIQKISKVKSKDYKIILAEFEKTMQEYFSKQLDFYLLQLEEKENIFKTDFEKKITNLIKTALGLGFFENKRKSQKQQNSYGFFETETDLFLDNEFALEYAKTQAGELIKGIDETTQKEISSIIEKALENGKTTKEIAKEITEKFDKYNSSRAKLIAHMEISNAYSYGESKYFDEVFNKNQIEGYKRSITQKDDNVRPSHKANELAGWIAKNQVYPGTGTYRAPHGFGCRCSDDYSIVNPKTGLIESSPFYTDKQISNFNNHFGDIENIIQEKDKLTALTYMMNLEEVFAIKYYSGVGHHVINNGFFTASNTDKDFQNIIPFFFGALNKLPKKEGVYYRGAYFDAENYKENDVINFTQFLSASASKKIAKNFLKNTIFKIKGTGIEIKNISLNPSEQEYIFLPNIPFVIEKIEKKKDYYLITLKEL